MIDLTDPDQPSLVVTVPFNGYVTHAALAGSRLIATVSGGTPDKVAVLDVADWRAPTVLGSVSVPSPGDIATDGDRALVSRLGGVCLVGFMQPAAPVVLGTWRNDTLPGPGTRGRSGISWAVSATG
ncbi:MAG: hypothetical protein IPH86_05630 [bacterium]|nr:hypothetical protein [bacterium]